MENEIGVDIDDVEDLPNNETWGFGFTLLWGILIAGLFFLIQIFVFGIYLLKVGIGNESSGLNEDDIDRLIDEIVLNGNLISWCTIATFIFCSIAIIIIIKFKRNSSISNYLGFKKIPLKASVFWLLVTIAFIFTSDYLTGFVDTSKATNFMVSIYNSADSILFLGFALVVAAPLFEELFFRGFLIAGFQKTLKPIATILLTSFLWTVIHSQYGFYTMGIIFIFGLILGHVRIKYDSILLPIALHMINNFISIVQVSFYVNQ